jgi:mono/diheme cytochrome c family protein
MLRKPTILLSVALLAACPAKQAPEDAKSDAKSEAGPESKPTGTADDEGETPTTKTHMQDHFSKADDIKAALIAGDLDKAREPAKWMAEHQADVDHPEAWKPHVESMRAAAQTIGGAEDLATASAAFVELAQACAQCHTAVGGPTVEVGEPPKSDASADVAAHMARHQWALEAMWKGLIGPSKDAWVAGAEVLAEAPLAPEALAPGQSVPESVTELAARVHTLGNEARDVADASGIPGQVYAELLSNCETCHSALRDN